MLKNHTQKMLEKLVLKFFLLYVQVKVYQRIKPNGGPLAFNLYKVFFLKKKKKKRRILKLT